jgi:hypothetical protein
MERRERWFVVVATAAALVVAVAFAFTVHHPAAEKGCSSEIVAGFMGGETHVVCATGASEQP